MRHPKQPQKAAKEEDPEKVEWEEHATEMELSTKHGHGAQKTFRIERVARMLANGLPTARICVVLGEKWGRAPRTIQNYIGDAWRLLEHRSEQSPNMLRGMQMARINRLWRLAEEQKSPRAMADTIELLNRMAGLNATEQKQHALTGADGAPLMAIVELPDNGRGGNQQASGMAVAPTPSEGQSDGDTPGAAERRDARRDAVISHVWLTSHSIS